MTRTYRTVGWAVVLLALSACGGVDPQLDVEPPFENEELIGGGRVGEPADEHAHEHGGTVSAEAITGSLPVGTALVTTDALNLRTGPGTTYAVILTMPYGSRVTVVQSAPQNGFYNVKYGTTTGWASGTYLNKATSGVVVSGGPVVAHAQAFANAMCNATGACNISTYEGHQPTRDRALDTLASNAYGQYPSDNYALGNAVANYALNNWGTYRILYVIWKQRINHNDGRGWLLMEDRGSITQNHYDHVHVSFNP
jgi:hypothetical protein